MSFNIANYIDEVALLIGANRLPGESDEAFVDRIKRLSKIRYNTDYNTLIRSCHEQCGLRIKPFAKLTCIYPFTLNIDEEFVHIRTFPAYPAIGKYIRIFYSLETEAIKKIHLTILQHSEFTFTVTDNYLYSTSTRELLFRGSNYKVYNEVCQSRCTRLVHQQLVPDSLGSQSPYVIHRKETLPELKISGDYFVDEDKGYLEVATGQVSPFIVTYSHFSDIFFFELCEINLTSAFSIIKYGLSDRFLKAYGKIADGKVLGK